MILIITSRHDGHIEAVTRNLDAVGEEWIRLNVEDLATNAEITITPATGSGFIAVRDSGRVIDLQHVRSVWFRKPEPVDLSHLGLDEGAREYVEAEFNEILHGVYALLRGAYWINDPFTTRIAHRKLMQLQVARRAGFRTPPTIVTNNADAALRFAEEIRSDLAIKSLGALSVTQEAGGQVMQYGIFTRRISRCELAEFRDKVRFLPTQFQQFIEKRFEMRITCVGKQVFPCRIIPRRGEITEEDCRFDIRGLEHSPFECPELHDRLHQYMQALGLNFACFDFIMPPDGEPVFLEANANGQWLWVQDLTGLPIGSAIAEELLYGDSPVR